MSAVPSTEERVQQTARTIFAAMAGEKPGRLSKERLQGEMMEWAMADERLKVEMLRFVDVFPTLRSRAEIARHLREYFAREGVAAPAALRWGVSLTGQALARRSAGERRHPPPDEGVRAALHRGPGCARRRPGPQGAAQRRCRLHA